MRLHKNILPFIAGILTLVSFSAYSQARLMLNGAYVVMNGGTSATPIYLVMDNSATNAITRSSGGIISEREYDMIQWDIGTATGSYVVPFQYSTTSYIPLTFNNAGGAGVGASGVMKFSTWHTVTDNLIGTMSTTGVPSDVTNMHPATSTSSPTATDDSYYVVDRFWVLDGNTGYTTKPNPVLTFTYLNGSNAASEVSAPNQAIDGTLIAQRFNSTSGSWSGYLGQSGTTSVSGTTSTVTTGTTAITAAGFYRSWTLSSLAAPLPIQLISFTVNCNNYYALLQWTTATETNNDYFTIERTQDGVNYETVAVVKGAGNSTTSRNYSAVDYSPLAGISYYRISQTDLDGTTTHLNTVVYTPCENIESINAFSTTNYIDVQINSASTDTYTFSLYNTLGQVVLTQTHNVSVGMNDFKLNPVLTKGLYIIRITGTTKVYSKKLVWGAR